MATFKLTRGKSLDDPVYFTVDGERWRVHEVVTAGRGYRRVTVPSSKSVYRVFVNAQGEKRFYRFTRGEIREITMSRLDAQLRKADMVYPPGVGHPIGRPGQHQETKEHDYGTIGGPTSGGEK